MDGKVAVGLDTATLTERNQLLSLIRNELAGRVERIMQLAGLTWLQFEQLFDTLGEIKTLKGDSSVVGYCWLEQRGRELHLHALFVLPDMRGQGIGTLALESIELAYRNQIDIIELGVEQNNPAKRLYSRHGFTVVQTIPDMGFEIMRKQVAQK